MPTAAAIASQRKYQGICECTCIRGAAMP